MFHIKDTGWSRAGVINLSRPGAVYILSYQQMDGQVANEDNLLLLQTDSHITPQFSARKSGINETPNTDFA